MQEDPPVLASAASEFKLILSWVLSGLIEAFFLSCWVLTQWLVNEYVIARFPMQGLDALTLTVAQWIFAVATLIPILFRLIKLVATMGIRTFRDIRDQWRNTE